MTSWIHSAIYWPLVIIAWYLMNNLRKPKCFIFFITDHMSTTNFEFWIRQFISCFFSKYAKNVSFKNWFFYWQKTSCSPLKIKKSIFEKKIQLQTEFHPIVYYLLTYLIGKNLTNHHASSQQKIQQTKMLFTCYRFGEFFLFGLVWQYSTNKNKYNKGRFKVMPATYLQQ